MGGSGICARAEPRGFLSLVGARTATQTWGRQQEHKREGGSEARRPVEGSRVADEWGAGSSVAFRFFNHGP